MRAADPAMGRHEVADPEETSGRWIQRQVVREVADPATDVAAETPSGGGSTAAKSPLLPPPLPPPSPPPLPFSDLARGEWWRLRRGFATAVARRRRWRPVGLGNSGFKAEAVEADRARLQRR
uniref:DUF834 domain-containing protein n=1 Tax=Oryza nivara TaxID=4536 RepID=A0A0E0GP66_ORYNI